MSSAAREEQRRRELEAEMQEVGEALIRLGERELLDRLRAVATLDGAPGSLKRKMTDTSQWHGMLAGIDRAVQAEARDLAHDHGLAFGVAVAALQKVARVAAQAALLAALTPMRAGGADCE